MTQTTNNTQTPPAIHPDGQMRIKQAAALIGVSPLTLRRWWQAEPPKFMKPSNVNGILLFKNSDILEFIDSQHTNSDEV